MSHGVIACKVAFAIKKGPLWSSLAFLIILLLLKVLGSFCASSSRRFVAPLCCVCCVGVVRCLVYMFVARVCTCLHAVVSSFLCLFLVPGVGHRLFLSWFFLCLLLFFYLFGCFVFVLLLLSLYLVRPELCLSEMYCLCCRPVCCFAGLLFVLLFCPFCFPLVGLSSSLLPFSVPLSLFFFSPLLSLSSPLATLHKSSVIANKSCAKKRGQCS